MPGILDQVRAELHGTVRGPRRHAVPAGRLVRRRGARGGGKDFVQPPFWSLDSMRLPLLAGTQPGRETIEHNFEGYVQGAYKADGPVFACIVARLRVFAQAKFLWCVDDEHGQPGELFTSPALRRLRYPGPNMTMTELLAMMEVDASLAGNSYWTYANNDGVIGNTALRATSARLVRLRPDWVWIIIDSKSGDPNAADARCVGFLYDPPASVGYGKAEPVILLPEEVAHYAPLPDPIAKHRGMSWLTPILREISSDRAATQHKLNFFERGATLQTVASLSENVSPAAFDEFVERFRADHEGTDNAFGTLFLGGGADVTVIGADLQKLDYKAVQGGGETRIAAAAGVHPALVGLSEGLAGSTLNEGNFSAARRIFVDGTMAWLWSECGAALSTLVPQPRADAYLTVDMKNVPFAREDAKDIAEIQQLQAQVLRSMIDGGWEPDAAVDWLITNDLRKLVGHHTGNVSVQLQPAGPNGTVAPVNGSAGANGARGDAEETAKAVVHALIAAGRT